MTKQNACIICTKENVEGSSVVEDKVIEVLRKIKGKFGAVKGYKLMVCDDCLEKYEKRRKTFERNIIIYGGIGIVIALFLLIFNFSIGSLLAGIILFLVLMIMAMMGYTPRIEKKEVKEDGKKSRRKKK